MIIKDQLKEEYSKSFGANVSGKEYVTLEKNNASNDAEFAIYGNRLASWLAKRFAHHSKLDLSKGHLLEIGCGMGRIMKPLSIYVKSITGLIFQIKY